MSDWAAEDVNSTQPAETTDLDQLIAAKKLELAEQERLARSAGLRFHAYSDGSLYALEERQRRAQHDLDRHAPEREDRRVLDRVPELAAREQLPVVPEADPVPRVRA